MSKEKQIEKETGRLTFPEDEARLPWLGLLLEMYHTTDQGVAQGIAQAQRRGRKLACARGCASCCRSHSDIPVYPLELMGIAWYLMERIKDPFREIVREQMARHQTLGACPFLVEEACAIHPLRPMACRLFNVFDHVCVEGEDAYHTRRDDVLTPVPFYKTKALALMLKHHHVPTESERRAQVASGQVHGLAQSLRAVRWENLAQKMPRV